MLSRQHSKSQKSFTRKQ